MKNKLPTILLVLSLSTLVGFDKGDQVELDAYVNARTNPSFYKYNKNIKTQLSKGTTGLVLEVKKFAKGNAGIKMQVTSGPKAGQSYWVYYNSTTPAIKLLDRKPREGKERELSVKEIQDSTLPPNKDLVQLEDIKAETKEAVVATRDAEEHAVVETAKEAQNLKESVDAVLSTAEIQRKKDCLNSAAPSVPQGYDHTFELDANAKLADLNDITRNIAVASSEPIIEATKKEIKEVAKVEPKVEPKIQAASTNLPASVYTPQQAVTDIDSSPLKFIGRDLMPGSGKNRTCVFENEKVYVLYLHCMGNKKEEVVSEIEVFSKDGGIAGFYGEMFGGDKPFSTRKRDEYTGDWKLHYIPTQPTGVMNIARIKKRMLEYQNGIKSCYVGGKSQKSPESRCSNGLVFKDGAEVGSEDWSKEEKERQWIPAAEEFWKNPPAEWYSVQQKLRKLVKDAPY